MKVHRVLVEAVINALEQIFIESKYADKVIERIFKANSKWGSRDRAYIAENVYEMVRWWRLINFLGDNNESNINKGSLWHLFGVWQVLKGAEYPAWTEFKNVNPSTISKRKDEALKDIAISQSIPDWLNELGKSQLGDSWPNEITALNKTADFIIRTNTLKTTRANLLKELAKLDVKAEPLVDYPDAIRITKRANLFSTPLFRAGMFEVQDASSQKVAAFLNVQPGMHVIDACAGAGGKTLHLSSLMQSKGRIISMDTEAWKLDELKKRAKRAGAQNIETRVIDNNTISKLKNSADRVLLDVPCSGLGVIKRNPDAKWKLKPEFINNIIQTQQHILAEYSQMVKPGGYLVYATCSILPSENNQQVELFLKNNTSFELLKQEIVSPFSSGFDGFFMALLKKTKN
jgi:16S rRNA (cytosine967-C5)-methyltransferase